MSRHVGKDLPKMRDAVIVSTTRILPLEVV